MTKKNIVFMINVKNALGDGNQKVEYEMSIDSWKRWAENNDSEVFVMEEPVLDPKEMHIIWQRYFLWDIFDNMNMDVDQVILVDCDTLVHPKAPNVFNQTEHKYCLVHDFGSYDWIIRGMEHYKEFVFNGDWINFWEYGNSGFQIVNHNHRAFFQSMKDFYFENKEMIQSIQKTYGIGTDKTPLNFMLKRHNIEKKLLPYSWNMTCFEKREILAEDTKFFEMGWMYHFNGINGPKDKVVPMWMELAYKKLYHPDNKQEPRGIE